MTLFWDVSLVLLSPAIVTWCQPLKIIEGQWHWWSFITFCSQEVHRTSHFTPQTLCSLMHYTLHWQLRKVLRELRPCGSCHHYSWVVSTPVFITHWAHPREHLNAIEALSVFLSPPLWVLYSEYFVKMTLSHLMAISNTRWLIVGFIVKILREKNII